MLSGLLPLAFSTSDGVLLFGAALGGLAAGGAFYLARSRLRFAEYRFRVERDMAYSRFGHDEVRLEDLYRRLETFLPEIMERLPERVAKEVIGASRAESSAVLSAIQNLQDTVAMPQLDRPTDGDTGQRELVREISHALNTPLSQAEAAVTSTHRALTLAHTDPALMEGFSQVAVSVAICKAFLAAFRLVVTRTTQSDSSAAVDLDAMVRQAAELYCERHHRHLEIQVEVGSSLAGYDDSYVIAMILPLLDNAIEAAPSGSMLAVSRSSTATETSLSVSNSFVGEGPTDAVYAAGKTTKTDHEGLGLPTVCRLASAAGGRLSHVVRDDRVTFTVTLPGFAHELG